MSKLELIDGNLQSQSRGKVKDTLNTHTQHVQVTKPAC